jgi:hypothetical protein
LGRPGASPRNIRRTSPAGMPAVTRVNTSSAASRTVCTKPFFSISGCTAIRLLLAVVTKQVSRQPDCVMQTGGAAPPSLGGDYARRGFSRRCTKRFLACIDGNLAISTVTRNVSSERGAGPFDIKPLAGKLRAVTGALETRGGLFPLVQTAKMGANHVERFDAFVSGVDKPELASTFWPGAGHRWAASSFRAEEEHAAKLTSLEARHHEKEETYTALQRQQPQRAPHA